MRDKNIKKVVLAYSGGLDTSVCIPWIKEHYGCEVIAFAADLGQKGEDLSGLNEKAIKTGASKLYIEDLQEEFVNEYVGPAIKANAMYEGRYLLATALGRPLIVKKMVEVARKEGADALAHGATGKGNDQVRFDLAFMSLAPDLKIIAPVREWEFRSRDEEIEYAKNLNIPVPVTKEKPYSIDSNLWGGAIECGVLEDPWLEAPDDIYCMTTIPQNSPDQPEIIEIEFTQGLPIALNGEKMSLLNLIEALNKIAGRHGIGITDLIENRLVGIKSREVYECPAGTVINFAHKELESLVLDKDTIHYKMGVSQVYSQLIYDGKWFSPLKQALDSFINETQIVVTGTVRLKLYKGNCLVQGRKSKFALYSKQLATYDIEDIFDHSTGDAFCRVWGLPLKTISENRIAKV